MPAEPCLLIGDIGGTNARFAIADPARPAFTREKTLRCADFETADDAIGRYLKAVKAPRPTVICLAAAGPIVDQRVRFTNNNWTLAVDDLQATFDTSRVQLLNDFEAIAYSIPLLTKADCMPIGLPVAADLDKPVFTLGVVGPGTGLGAVGLCKREGVLFPIVGEAGHVGFAPQSQVQLEILQLLRERYDRVSVERVVSGPGIENIYWALTRMQGATRARLRAADIFARGARDPLAAEAVQVFFEILGQVAGNLALTLGASDGIYVAGGIARRYPEQLSTSRFRTGFENKGRHRSLMERIPTQLLLHQEPGLLGASYCALRLHDGS